MEVALIAKNLLYFLLLFISLTIHEWAHAWVADKLGDPNPRATGRVSLNPLVHVDLMGTIVFPIICIVLSTGFLFGWGKPVVIDAHYFKKPDLGELLAGSAGIFGNLILCLTCSFVLAFIPSLHSLAYAMLTLNAFLITFNCLPLPSLDGFCVCKYFFKISERWIRFAECWGFIILLILINIPIVRHYFSCMVQGIFTFFVQLGLKLQLLVS
ncbi:MAG: site-2 protease family protein [Puniceicoccales bacterium]|jgi:Zn-dependent protease|nr:site-2 protease family protein [Puniceicoccales bacterium]